MLRAVAIVLAFVVGVMPTLAADPYKPTIAKAPRTIPLLQGTELTGIIFACGAKRRSRCTLDSFMADVRVCALLVLKHGKVRLERYNRDGSICRSDDAEDDEPDGRAKSYGLASVTKSINSTLLGHILAAKWGARSRADFERAVAIPIDRYILALSATTSRGGYAGVPLEWALGMRSGVRWREYGWFNDGESYLRRTKDEHTETIVQFASWFATRRPGQKRGPFNYSGLDSGVLAAVNASLLGGQSVTDFLRIGIWSAIGAEAKARWRVDPAFTPFGNCCMEATVGDLARFGQLVLRRGRAPDGRRVVPSAWFDLATRHGPGEEDLIPDPLPACDAAYKLGYRYQWWLFSRPRNDFTAIGIGGQFVHIFPDDDVVVVQISDWGRWGDGDRRECETFRAHDALVSALR